ncbi:MAG: hypothetical protein Q9170_006079 [Blastenia crenularia]
MYHATVCLVEADTMSAQALSTTIAAPHFPYPRRNVCYGGIISSRSIVHGQRNCQGASGGGPSYSRCATTMPEQTSPQPLLTSLASSMSALGNSVDIRDQLGSEVEGNSILKPSPGWAIKQHSQNSSVSSQPFRRDSTSTFESAESSPTTTVSTMDSAITEPSPSSSPESATSMLPISSFKSLSTSSIATTITPDSANSPASPFSTLRADSPNKKMRNTKNLSVNIAASTRSTSQLPKPSFRTNTNAPASHAFSAPPTPSFIVPPKPPRRRPSNLGLTITTPDSGASSQASDNTVQAVPPTPAEPPQRTIRYLQTASTMPTISSPTVAPEGGMRLPPFGNASIPSRTTKGWPALNLSRHSSVDSQASPIKVQMLEHVQEEPDYDLPLSREAKSPAYPQGPICIYDPHIYLYLEPSDTEASEFDVVINVAREVKNPFAAAADMVLNSNLDTSHTLLDQAQKALASRDSLSEPPSAVEAPFSSSLGFLPGQGHRSASSTPKASKSKPEYIHIPWDHNTNLVDDLLSLCELIDRRVQDGKRVLIHCQCGVSRSASLVVAYGLYKNPQLSVQDAYDAVKSRSRWIGPNMNLIYQLNEFRGKLAKKTAPSLFSGPSFSKWQGWKATGAADLNAKLESDTLPQASRPSPSHRKSHHEPLMNSLKKEAEPTPIRANSFSPPGSAQFSQPPTSGTVSPGPSSAPADMQWSPIKDRNESQEPRVLNEEPEQMPDTAILIKDSSKRKDDGEKSGEQLSTSKLLTVELPAPASTQEPASAIEAAPAPTSPPKMLPGGFSSIPTRKQAPRPLPFRQLPKVEDERNVVDDVPKTPSILSPRAAEFTASPFHRTAAGDLAGSSIFEQTLMSPNPLQDEDPRSPVKKGEAPITRNIFDVLC